MNRMDKRKYFSQFENLFTEYVFLKTRNEGSSGKPVEIELKFKVESLK